MRSFVPQPENSGYRQHDERRLHDAAVRDQHENVTGAQHDERQYTLEVQKLMLVNNTLDQRTHTHTHTRFE